MSGPPAAGHVGWGLVRACHPEPTVAVTGLSAVLAAAVGVSGGRWLLVTAAVLTGQLSIGWSNDLLDAGRDRMSGRRDKPLVTGALRPQTLRTATTLAVLASVILSLATGLVAGATHLVVVAGGWAYNVWLKRTPASFVPYAVSFGLLPAFVLLAGGIDPPLWAVLAGALLGVGAHFFNVLPDLEADRATGVRGLPVLMGAAASRIAGALLLLGAAAVLALAPSDHATWTLVVLGVAAAVALGAATTGRGGARSKAPFLLALVAAGLDVALLAGQSATLH